VKKIFLTLVFLVIATGLIAQPMHYNALTGSGNTFPLGQTNGKAVNWLFPPSVFSNPTPCPPGQEITKIYVRMYGAGSRTYTNLHILMAQTTLTNLTSGQFYSGTMDTVFKKDTSLTSTGANTWVGIKLHTPFAYDPTKALVVFMGQCHGAGSGMYVLQTTLSGVKRTWSVGGCPFTPYSSGDGRDLCMGIDVQAAGPTIGAVPEILYYKFDESQSDSTENFAIPGGGTPWAPVPGLTMGGTGQFGGALQGNGLSSSSNYVNTGWGPDLGGSDWTISVWFSGLHSTTALNYLWGDPGTGPSWRCFYSGAAGVHGVLQRLAVVGGTDITIPGVGPGPTVLTLVYDSAAGVVKAYKNGVFSNQQTQAGALNITGPGPFKVGGYSSSSSFPAGSLMDEFRFYRRALDTAEISATWNKQLPLVTAIPTPVLNIPDKFNLSQNYPNPFNPATKINYTIPINGLVILKVYDVLGKEVATIVNEVKNAGSYTVNFNASNIPSGTYFYRLEAGDYMDVKKMILLK